MASRRFPTWIVIAVAVVASLLVVAACSSPTKAPTSPSGEFGVSPGGGFDQPPGPVDAPGGDLGSGYPPSLERLPTEANPYPGPDESSGEEEEASGAESEGGEEAPDEMIATPTPTPAS